MGKAAKGTTSTAKSLDINVFAEGVDEAGRRYFLLGANGKPISKLQPILASRFASDKKAISSALTNAGLNLISTPAQTAFFNSVQKWEMEDPSFEVTTRVGWHGGSYVLPDMIIGPNNNIYALLAELDSDVIAKYRVRNSLSDWQTNIGRLCIKNSRLMFAVSLAFTGPILRFVPGIRSGGFQIYGAPETGKSTAAMVAGSVWGCRQSADNGFIETWNTTANKVEITALGHNDGLLILDETKNAGNTDTKRIEM